MSNDTENENAAGTEAGKQPAFPRSGYWPDTNDCGIDSLRERMPTVTEPQAGLSMRDYFAAKAMQAHLIIDAIVCNVPGKEMLDMISHDDAAEEAYRTADAMLKARRS